MKLSNILISRTLCLCLVFLFSQNLSGKTFNIQQIGAKGDGKSDNSALLSKMVSDLTHGDKIYIPDGVYLVKDLVFQGINNISIYGTGTLKAIGSSNPYFMSFVGCRNLTLENFTVDANEKKNLGIDISSSPNASLKNVCIQNVMGRDKNWAIGARIRRGSHDFFIENVVIKNVTSLTRASTGVFIYKGEGDLPSKRGVIKGCRILDIKAPSDADGIKVQQIGDDSELLITNCIFKNNWFRAIKIQTNNVKVLKNKVQRDDHLTAGYAVFSIYGNRTEICENFVQSEGETSFNMFADVSTVRDVKIIGNNFANSRKAKSGIKDFIDVKRVSSDKISSVKNLMISNNNVSNIRNFIRIGTNIENILMENNTVNMLNSNLVHIRNDKKIGQVSIVRRFNKVSYTKYNYTEIYKDSKHRIILNDKK